jgi:3-oxoacyl-[acyl-carrier protein] reductase
VPDARNGFVPAAAKRAIWGSRGIGAAISTKLAAPGASVAINFRNGEAAAREVADEIRRSGGNAEIFAGDVADPSAVKSMVSAVSRRAGGSTSWSTMPELSECDPGTIDVGFFAEQFNANALSTVLVTQEAVAHFPAFGGHVVNMSSNLALRSVAEGTSIYAAAKAAVSTITQCFARELGKRKITGKCRRSGRDRNSHDHRVARRQESGNPRRNSAGTHRASHRRRGGSSVSRLG